jgi:hypothetical protein
MVQETKEQIKLTEEQERDRYFELSDKESRTPEEQTELKGLKTKYSETVNKRIATLTYKSKEAEERAEKAEQARIQAEQRIAELEAKTKTPVRSANNSTVEFGGKAYYTDEALQSMIESGEMKETEAYRHQRERDKDEAADRAYNRLKKEETVKNFQEIYKTDREKVLSEYPIFDKTSDKYNPQDPLYIEADRIFRTFLTNDDGTVRDPRAFSKAISEAKRNLKVTDTRPDVSDELSVNRNTSTTSRTTPKSKDVLLSEDEKEIALRTYVHGNIINPITKKAYTETEAIAKATKAKKERAERLGK